MLRSKLGLLSLCALGLGLMAFASSAQATVWLILENATTVRTGAELPATVGLTLESDGTLLSKLSSINVSVLCTTANLEGTSLEAAGKLTEGGKVTFTVCTVPMPSGGGIGCTVKSPGAAVGKIKSNEFKGQLEKEGEIRLESKVGEGALANLIFGHETGKICTLPEEVSEPIKGALWLKDCEGKAAEHRVSHLLNEFTGNGATLTLGASPATIDGSANAALTGTHLNKLWGAIFP